VGLNVRAIVIIGLPGESYESLKETFKLIGNFRPDSVQTYIFHPVPGSPEFIASTKRISQKVDPVISCFPPINFLEAPASGSGKLSREEIVRWFMIANQVFSTRFNHQGDRLQLKRVINGFYFKGADAFLGFDINLANSIGLAQREIAIASTGEFTFNEVRERARRVTGLKWSLIDSIISQYFVIDRTAISLSTDNFQLQEEFPTLAPGIVLIRTSKGGLVTDARPKTPFPTDDLLRRTFSISRDGYEILLRCNGVYSIDDIQCALRAILDDPNITGTNVLESLRTFRQLGFLQKGIGIEERSVQWAEG